MLTESELQQIRDEAEKLYPETFKSTRGVDLTDEYFEIKRRAYVFGVTSERERSNELMKAFSLMIGDDLNALMKIASKSHQVTITVDSAKLSEVIITLTNYQKTLTNENRD